MSRSCPRCNAAFRADASECPGCGMPTTFMGADAGMVFAGGDDVVEPEVLDSIEEAERARGGAPAGPVGCALGPGCGCLGLPLAALAGAGLSALLALLWILKLGRLPLALVRYAGRGRRGPGAS